MNIASYSYLINWAQTNVGPATFYVLAFLAIPLAFGVLLDSRIIRSGFMLIGVFGTISGLFLLLQAQFLAMAQIMLYAVGITLVVVIALMLTNPKLEDDVSPSMSMHRTPALITAILMFITIYLAIRSEGWTPMSNTISPMNIQQIGFEMLTSYALPFEFASILLLVALIGAIMLAKADRAPVPVEGDAGDLNYERKEDVVEV